MKESADNGQMESYKHFIESEGTVINVSFTLVANFSFCRKRNFIFFFYFLLKLLLIILVIDIG